MIPDIMKMKADPTTRIIPTGRTDGYDDEE